MVHLASLPFVENIVSCKQIFGKRMKLVDTTCYVQVVEKSAVRFPKICGYSSCIINKAYYIHMCLKSYITVVTVLA